MKKLLLSLFILSIAIIPACKNNKNKSFDDAKKIFVKKYKVLTGEKNINGLTSRLDFVNKNISEYGILYDSLSRDSLLTGYDYGQFYDWDLYFENIYQMFNGESRYCYKNLNAFFIRQEPNGHINRAFGSRDKIWCKQMFKPFIAQIVLLGMRQTPDKEWLKENYTHIVRYLSYWITAYDKDHNNLSVWENSGHSGMDNQTSRVPKSFIDEGVDLNCYIYKEYLALAKLAEMIDYNQDAITFVKKAELIKKAINTILWDEKDGIYYDRIETTGELNKVKCIPLCL